MIIYVDVLIAVNFFISYFLMMAASVISGYTYIRKRIVFSSLISSLFCLYIFVQSNNNLIDFAVKTFSLILCAAIAFGLKNLKKFVLQAVCFVMLNALLTGITAMLSLKSTLIYQKNMFFYININPVMLVIFSAVIYIVITLFASVKEHIMPNQIYKLELIADNFNIENIDAFYDSGFKVRDIVSNKDVIMISFKKIKENLPKKLADDVHNFYEENYEKVHTEFIPVFFSTVCGSGLMPAIKTQYVKINGRKLENIIVAFIKNELSENVTAIFGTSIKRQL